MTEQSIPQQMSNILFAMQDGWPLIHSLGDQDTTRQHWSRILRMHGDFADEEPPKATELGNVHLYYILLDGVQKMPTHSYGRTRCERVLKMHESLMANGRPEVLSYPPKSPNPSETPMKIKVAVLCSNANGEPDFFYTVIECSKAEINNGDHYDQAKDLASEAGYEPSMAFDENDPAWNNFRPREGEESMPLWLHTELNAQVGDDELTFPQLPASESRDFEGEPINGFWFDARQYITVSDLANFAYTRITWQFGAPEDKQDHQMLFDLVQDCGKRHGGKVLEQAENFHDYGNLLESIEFLLAHDGLDAIERITEFVNKSSPEQQDSQAPVGG